MKNTSAVAILVAALILAGSIYIAGNQVARAISKPYDECVEVVERHTSARKTGADARQKAYDAARMQCRSH